jgi:hypothetical protein
MRDTAKYRVPRAPMFSNNDDGYDFERRLHTYLDVCLEQGMTDQAAVDASVDMAATKSTDWWFVAERERRQTAWDERRKASLSVGREPREIDMELDPVHFWAMATGRKPIEGRAYDPSSDKNYPDIRAGDIARYSLSNRKQEFAAEIGALSLGADCVMLRPIVEIHFAPTVFGLYENLGSFGEELQPMHPGTHNVLMRGAVYHAFPDYSNRIVDNGFIAIEHPRDIPELKLASELTT